MGIVVVMIVELIFWDPRPRYVPKRLRTSWDLSILSHYWKSWLKGKDDRYQVLSMITTALTAQQQSSRTFCADTDSYLIAIDNCASSCMTPSKEDFISPPRPSATTITGMGGTSKATHIGTVRWPIEDDAGVTHHVYVRDTRYCPDAPFRLLCPQHLAQQSKNPSKTTCTTTYKSVTLTWPGFTKTIPLLEGSNVALFRSAAGYENAFSAISDSPQPVCFTSPHVIPNDVEESDKTNNVPTESEGESDKRRQQQEKAPTTTAATPQPATIENDDLTDFSVDIATKAMESEEADIHSLSPSNQLLVWHYRLNHVPFPKLQAMARRGDIPKTLSECSVPLCASCNYAKATRRPWRTKGARSSRAIPPIKAAGDCVSVDQLESSTPGLIAQLRGFLTKDRYNSATVFVDHFTRLSYIHLQKSTNAEETLTAKAAFEAWANTLGVKIRHYHADNGRFAERAWMSHCDSRGQTLSFAAQKRMANPAPGPYSECHCASRSIR